MKPAVISLAILIGILGGFYGGFRYGETKAVAATTTIASSNSGSGQAGQGGRGNFGGGNGAFLGGQAPCPSPGATPATTGNGRGGASGTITAVGDGTLTLHDARCNTDVKVSFASNATVTKVTQGSTADLKTGETVTVVGQRQADGSVKATAISIQPARNQ
jgi:hypothetical protein